MLEDESLVYITFCSYLCYSVTCVYVSPALSNVVFVFPTEQFKKKITLTFKFKFMWPLSEVLNSFFVFIVLKIFLIKKVVTDFYSRVALRVICKFLPLNFTLPVIWKCTVMLLDRQPIFSRIFLLRSPVIHIEVKKQDWGFFFNLTSFVFIWIQYYLVMEASRST